MNVTVFGMGYVGCVTAACLAELGHIVVGVDLDDTKVSLVNSGLSPIIEPGLEDAIQRMVELGRLSAISHVNSIGDMALICVGTPSNDNGSLGLDQMFRVLETVGDLLKKASNYVVINIRSTVLPGTVEGAIVPALEKASGRSCGQDFGICMNPEFMRETTAVKDFADPPFTIIGAQNKCSADRVAALYSTLCAPIEFTSIKEAEMIKYACNAFHAVKVSFANEIGNLAKSMGIDSHRVMRILCEDKKLNLSPYYLKPGFAFGGSCLPKDLRAILHRARQLDVEVPLLDSLLETNRKQIEVALNLVRKTGKSRIGIFGLSFKAGTDDLRESPVVTLIEMLIGKGYRLSIYDEEVSLAKLHGANRRYIEQSIPHISCLLKSTIQEVIDHSEVIVISKRTSQFVAALEEGVGNCAVIDLVRISPDSTSHSRNYEGISW